MSRLQRVLLTSLLAIFLCHPALALTSEQEMLAQGKQHLQNQKYSFATTWLERLLKTYPATSHRKEVLHLLAQGYLATGKEEKAADALRKLVKQYPEEAAKLSSRQLELAKRPPLPEAIEQGQPAAPPSSVISGGLMADEPKPIPIIDPPLENPGGPAGEQVPSDATNIYATSALADNAVDISETSGREGGQRGVETIRKNQPAAAPLMERPEVKAAGKPAPAAVPASPPAAAPVKPSPATRDAASFSVKPAAADKKAAVAPSPTAPSATAPSAVKDPATKPSAAAPPATVRSAATASAATPASQAPAAAASVAVAPPAPAPAKTATAPAKTPARAVAPARPATPKTAAKAVTVDEKGLFTLKIGEYLLPLEVSDIKKKLVRAKLSPHVVEGRKRMPVVRLEVEGVTDQESAQKKLEDVRKASGVGIIVVSKEGRRRLYAGSYLNQNVAEKEQQRLAAAGIRSSLQKAVAPVPTYSVTAGPFATREAALEGERRLASEGVQAVLVQTAR